MELRWLVKDDIGTLQYRSNDGNPNDWTDVPVTREIVNHFERKETGYRENVRPARDRYIEETLTAKELALQQGYTGDICVQCGGARMRRNGPCLVCEQCGQTTGCS